ncbi:MAG: hypothetical protein KAT20_07060 [Desulfuromonadales bacterium]|nr:hypothetical protein [Desulfuromonadales bacterium]
MTAEGSPGALLRRVREDEIFHYALKPNNQEYGEELRSVVDCAAGISRAVLT